ncbi:LysR family transcriptional regulator [Paramagnetospirillum magneticum]|uniref:Transcriptional regulator n=1 Tax=Paramagnetospirillum magneticum (strain ATCC 700264 / AMB-1) TaxID=342108 RepID=Q2W7V0_PARM1|nr:LysR family transcriptional regulator [Paramagnetospirillum magneticum]BAE50075.1 Transcriptional regulator [Paramagnetospirillum magneticum AMB-1]
MDRLDELAIFIAILEVGSLAGAARRLRRSPPAITRCLAGLEDRLGVRLVERTTRRLAPTDAGRRFAEQARHLLSGYNEALRSAGADEPLRGRLRVTAPVVFGRRHVTPIIVDFLRAYPQISIEAVFSDNNLDLIEEELDVAVRIGTLADSTLVARRVGEVESVLVASPGYIAAHGLPLAVDELAEHDVIFTSGRPVLVEWRLIEGGRERNVRLTPRLMVNQVEASLAAARAGLGIARALSYQVVDDLAAGHLVRVLPGSGALQPVHLVVPGGRHMAARTRAFLNFATNGLQSIGIGHHLSS